MDTLVAKSLFQKMFCAEATKYGSYLVVAFSFKFGNNPEIMYNFC
jgi:hypothetical protein